MATSRAAAYYSRRDGSADIKIRILHHDQQRRVATHRHALPGDVTPGGRIRSAALQKQCDALIHRCLEVANDLSYRIEAMPIDDLAELIRGAVQGERPEGVDIYEYAERVTEGLAEHTRRGYKVALRALREYTERDRLDIAELRRPMLLGFVDFVRGRGDSPRVGGEWARGVDMYTVHAALNHSGGGRMAITETYVVRDWRLIWDANRAVLDLFDWSSLQLNELW